MTDKARSRNRTPFTTLLGAGLLAAGALHAPTAHADEAAGAPMPETCDVQLAFNQGGLTLPSNAPALLVVDRTRTPLVATLNATLVAGGSRTALTAATDAHGLSTLTLPELTAGSYSLEAAVSCSDSSERTLTTQLTLTGPVPLPNSVGTLVHVPSNPPRGVDKIRLEPSPEMRAFLPAARLGLAVDGSPSQIYGASLTSSVFELPIHTGDACIENGALHRDVRTVKVALSAAIAGVDSSPAPAELDVQVDCGAIQWTSGIEPGKSGASEGAVGSSGTGDSTGGCSAARGEAPVGLGVVASVVSALVLAARRRRRTCATLA